jgi:DNA ligase-1
VNRFADLLDMLAFTPSRNAKLSLLQDYFRTVPDPERGYALAAIARDLDIPAVKPAQLRELISSRMDAELFGYSYDYVGDLAETIALAWPEKADSRPGRNDAPGLAEVVETLQASSRREGPGLVENWLDRLDPPGRYALLKLVTGGFRMGLSSRLIKQALAAFGKVEVNEIEELWHGLSPPYADLFAWLEGSGPKPVNAGAAPFRPVMLSHAIEDRDFEKLDPADFAAEWKWDGIRVQATSERGISRLYTRTGDDISAAFPDLVDAIAFDGALDGELLVARPAGRRCRDRQLLRSAAAPQPQDRDSQGSCAIIRPSSAPMTCCRTAGGSSLETVCGTPHGSKLSSPAEPRTLRLLADAGLRQLG